MDALLFASTALILVAACFFALAASMHRQNRRSLICLRAAQRSANSHVQKSRMDLMETRNRARLLEDSFKHGTSAVEKMHQAIATTTFSLIDHFATDQDFRESAQRARDSHNNASRQIYDAARTTNKALHLLADTLITSRKEKKLTMRTRPKNVDKPTDEK
jgi:septal ring factor EnvC (AmiA/AmiB activator)